MEVQKLGCHALEDVVAAARRIERILEEQTDSKMERLITSVQDQIRLLKKDLKEAHDQISTHQAAATPTAALAATSAVTVAAAHPPPLAQLPPLAAAKPHPPSPARPSTHGIPRKDHISSHLAGSWIGDLPAASCVGKKDILYQTARPAQSSSACCVNKRVVTLVAHLKDMSWNCYPQKMVIKTPLMLEGSPEAKVTPVGCAVGPPITGQLTLEGIPVLGLVDTAASVTCMGFSVWWLYRAQWGPLKPFGGVVHGAHGERLQITGKTQHLDLQWGEALGRACFIVIIGLGSPPCLIGMDIMRLLRVHIDVTNGTATPAQPDPQTIYLNAAQQQKTTPQQNAAPQPPASQQQEAATQHSTPPAASRALLLQTTDIPAETARLVCCHNPWPSEDVYFCPEGRSAGVCDWSSRAFMRLRAMDSYP